MKEIFIKEKDMDMVYIKKIKIITMKDFGLMENKKVMDIY